MADGIRFFQLNTGAKIPSVGMGTWRADAGRVGGALTTAIKVFFLHLLYKWTSGRITFLIYKKNHDDYDGGEFLVLLRVMDISVYNL